MARNQWKEFAFAMKQSTKKKGYTLKDARTAAKNIMKDCLPRVKLQMQWFLDKTKPYLRKDTSKLDEIREFVEDYDLEYGKFKMLPWQLIAFVYTFGSFADMDLPKKLLVTMARKNGKTTMVSAFATAFAHFTPVKFMDIDLQATKQEQSMMLLNNIKKSLSKTGGESGPRGFKSADESWYISAKRGEYYPTSTRVNALATSAQTADGRNPVYCIVDEASKVEDEFFDIVTTSMSDALRNQQFTYISTLSENEFGWFKRTIDEVMDALEKGEEIFFAPLMFFTEKNEYDMDDEKMWQWVNPSFGQTVTIESLREEYDKASSDPRGSGTFLIRKCNMSGMSEGAKLCVDREAIDVCQGRPAHEVENMLEQNDCVIGVDVGVSQGMFAVCLMTRVDYHIYAKIKNFMCKDSYFRRKDVKNLRVLQTFKEREELIIAGEANIDNDVVIAYIADLCERYDVRKVIADRSSGGNSITDMMRDIHVPYEELNLGGINRRFPSNMIVQAIRGRQLHVPDSHLFRWELGNAGLKQVDGVDTQGEFPEGAYEIQKIKASQFNGVDGVFALMHSLVYLKENQIHESVESDVWKEMRHNIGEAYGSY